MSDYFVLRGFLLGPGSSKAHPFATAEFTNEYEGKYFFHRLAFHDFHRDVPADCFREGVNQEDWPKAFVNPDARTLRGLMDLKDDGALGIDPGLRVRLATRPCEALARREPHE